ncbi:MAG: hypothetical protein MUQ00_10680 [Candidatus Aminicenantes bacterium]|nr:hypothetical protein [Candidatus Aminicenantes bacterium]
MGTNSSQSKEAKSPVSPNTDSIQTNIPWVTERDIDMLLLEEFSSSPDFLKWFLAQIEISGQTSLISTACTVVTSTGESDLEITVKCDDKIFKILIEDKIGAPLQPRQPDRYRDRAKAYLHEGKCSAVKTVLIAPSNYFKKTADRLGFDYVVGHESIREWFDKAKDMGNRRLCKIAILDSALKYGTIGWKLVPNEKVTEFWRLYWELADFLAPELKMPKPRDRPATSFFIYFKPVSLTKNVSLVHKVCYGNVDLQFSGMGNRIGELEQRFGNLLDNDMQIEPASKSAVIRIRVPEIDMMADFSNSKEAVRKALRTAVRLLDWYKRVEKK